MKTRLISLILVSAALLSAAGTGARGTDFPPAADNGTMQPIDLPERLEALPDSLTPVFVNHIGRHGARFLSSEKKVERLAKALDTHPLTAQGRGMKEMLRRVIGATSGRWGALDSLGKAEWTSVARLLDALLPGFFAGGDIMATATYVPRAVESMYSFCHELGRLNPRLQMSASSGPDYNTELRFFDTDADYRDYIRSGKWKPVYEAFVAAEVPSAPAEALFTDPGAFTPKELRDLTLDIYGVIQSFGAIGLPFSPYEYMDAGAYAACARASNLQHALTRTDTYISDLPGRSARVLLRDIISTTETALSDPSASALVRGRFRFAHAETVMPLFSLMRLPGCNVGAEARPDAIARQWIGADVSPLGANFIMVVSKAPSGRIYATTYLNCRPVAPIPGSTATTVEWPRLLRHWQKML